MSDFWLRKMRTYFRRIDFDGDGKITRKDFEGMASRFAESGKLQPGRCKDLMETLTAVWDKHLTNLSQPEGMNQGQFIAAMQKSRETKDLKATLEGPLPLFFHAVDANDDGMISMEEYQEFFRILGLNPDMAPEAFRAIDTNADGQLSSEEFVAAGTEFFVKDDPNCPTKVFWGPLVD